MDAFFFIKQARISIFQFDNIINGMYFLGEILTKVKSEHIFFKKKGVKTKIFDKNFIKTQILSNEKYPVEGRTFFEKLFVKKKNKFLMPFFFNKILIIKSKFLFIISKEKKICIVGKVFSKKFLENKTFFDILELFIGHFRFL